MNAAMPHNTGSFTCVQDDTFNADTQAPLSTLFGTVKTVPYTVVRLLNAVPCAASAPEN